MLCLRCGREDSHYPVCTDCNRDGWEVDVDGVIRNFRTGERLVRIAEQKKLK